MAEKCKRGYHKSGNKCVKSQVYFNKKNSVNKDAMWIFIAVFGIILLAGIFFYGGNQGWFKSLSVIEDNDLIQYLDTPNHQLDYSCSLAISPGTIYVGDMTTGTLVDGESSFCQVFADDGIQWIKVYEGYTDANGLLVLTRTISTPGDYVFRAVCDLNNNNRVDTEDCLTNPAELSVLPRPDDTPEPTPEPSPTYSEGDIVYESEGSNTINVGGVSHVLEIPELGEGNCQLGVRFQSDWNYKDQQACTGLQGQEALRWELWDSVGFEWGRTDAVPVALGVDLHPTSHYWDYDFHVPWGVHIDVINKFPNCYIDYDYKVEIYAYSCA